MARRPTDIVSVETGLHRGAETALVPGEHVVGDSLDDDVVVMGDGLEAGHLTLRVEPGRLHTRRMLLAHAPVRLNGEGLASGDERPVRLPATIEAGDMRMVWRAGAGRGAFRLARPTRSTRIATVGVCALAATLILPGAEGVIDRTHSWLAGGGAGGVPPLVASSPIASSPIASSPVASSPAVPRDALATFSQAVKAHRRSLVDGQGRESTEERTRLARAPQPPAPAPRPLKIDEEPGTRRSSPVPATPVVPPLPRASGAAAASVPASPAASDAETAAAGVARRLREGGIAGVELAAADGMVVATGTLDARHEADWQATQRWFDERFAGDVQLVNQVRFGRPARSHVPSIEAVWVGDPSYVVVGNGKHVEGAVLRGGWTVETIAEAEVVLLRKASNERVTVKF